MCVRVKLGMEGDAGDEGGEERGRRVGWEEGGFFCWAESPLM